MWLWSYLFGRGRKVALRAGDANGLKTSALRHQSLPIPCPAGSCKWTSVRGCQRLENGEYGPVTEFFHWVPRHSLRVRHSLSRGTLHNSAGSIHKQLVRRKSAGKCGVQYESSRLLSGLSRTKSSCPEVKPIPCPTDGSYKWTSVRGCQRLEIGEYGPVTEFFCWVPSRLPTGVGSVNSMSSGNARSQQSKHHGGGYVVNRRNRKRLATHRAAQQQRNRR